MVELYFIRHGVTESNASGHLQGHRDVPLSAQGRREAEATAAHLKALLPGPVRLYSSPLRRAMETAETVAGALGVPITADAAWMEMDVGDLSGHSWAEAQTLWPEHTSLWYRDTRRVHFPGAAESIAAFMDRVQDATRSLLAADAATPILVVTHGGALNIAMRTVLQIGVPDAFPFRFDNCGITFVRWRGTHFRVERFNDTRHLAMLTTPSAFQVG